MGSFRNITLAQTPLMTFIIAVASVIKCFSHQASQSAIDGRGICSSHRAQCQSKQDIHRDQYLLAHRECHCFLRTCRLYWIGGAAYSARCFSNFRIDRSIIARGDTDWSSRERLVQSAHGYPYSWISITHQYHHLTHRRTFCDMDSAERESPQMIILTAFPVASSFHP
jgi:hypothetical protein